MQNVIAIGFLLGLASVLAVVLAVANAKLAYAIYREIFSTDRFRALGDAQKQRVLWASTSTKNPLYDPVRYVEPLIGRDILARLTSNRLMGAATGAFVTAVIQTPGGGD